MNFELPKTTFANRDEYQRKAIAEKIIALLKADIQLSPLVINGGWGTGKTEFCHKLINLISETADKFSPIYVDAFSADHADESLMTLLAAVLKALPKDKQKSLIVKALPAIRFGLKASLKAGVSWVLRRDFEKVADEFDKDIQAASDEAINKSIESLLADHVKADESIAALQQALIELTADQHVILFVDELDRCRPNFALSMLESIKHIFGVKGVQIVLLTNIDQLKSSISHCYGIDEYSAKRYLDKFIGFSLTLPQEITIYGNQYGHQYVSTAKLHLRSLIQNNTSLKDTWLQNTDILDFLESLIELNKLSLREVETLIKHFHVYLTIKGQNGLDNNIEEGYKFLHTLGIFLYCVFPELIIDKNESNFDVASVLIKTGIKGLPDAQQPYNPKPTHILVMLLVLENDLFKNELKISDEKKENWRQLGYCLFRHNRLSGSVNRYILEACKILRLETI